MRTSYIWSKTLWSLVLLIILYGLSYAFYDKPIDLWMHSHVLETSMLAQICMHIAWIFAPKHWLILAVLLALLGFFLKARRLLFWGTTVVISMVICFALKTLLARYRPELLFSDHLYGFHFFSLKHSMNSTPSGHAVAAFTGFYAFARLYKSRGMSIGLIILALLIGVSRILVTAHYPSDILFGAYVGVFTVLWCEAFFSKFFKFKNKKDL